MVVWLRIFQINDVYELDNFPSFYTLVNEYNNNNPTTTDDDNEVIENEQQQQQPHKTLIVLSGDFLAPSLLSSLDKGSAMVDILNRVGVTHVCFGNHECDVPLEALKKRILASNFVWLNSNMQQLNPILNSLPTNTPTTSNNHNINTRIRRRRSSVGSVNTAVVSGVVDDYNNGNGNGNDIIEVVTTPDIDIIDVTNPLDTTKNQTTIRVGLLGLLTNENGLYKPNSYGNATIEDIIPTTTKLLSNYADKEVDFWLPLTHQSMADDRQFAKYFLSTNTNSTNNNNSESGSRSSSTTTTPFPLIIGGHDHTIFDEIVTTTDTDTNPSSNATTASSSSSRIIKTGMDAKHTAVIDIIWDDDDNDKTSSSSTRQQPTISVKMVPTNSYKPNLHIQKCVDAHLQIVHELENAKLFPILNWSNSTTSSSPNVTTNTNTNTNTNTLASSQQQQPEEEGIFSTYNNRLQPSIGTTILTSMIRMGMQANVALMNAGSIRGNTIYNSENNHSPFFTYQDLKTEIPFPTNMVCIHLPGHILESTIRYSRQPSRLNPPIPSGGYIHTCNNIQYDDTKQQIISIENQSFQPNQLYLTALPIAFLNGIDNLVPLLEWVQTTNTGSSSSIIHSESSSVQPAKLVIVEFLSAILWLQLLGNGSFHDLDIESKGVLTRDDVRQLVISSKLYGDDDDDSSGDVADLIVDNVMSIADIHNTGTISPMDMIIVHLVATDLLSPISHHHYHQDDDDDSVLKQIIHKTAAKVLEKDMDDIAVINMVDRILQDHYLLPDDHDVDDENVDPSYVKYSNNQQQQHRQQPTVEGGEEEGGEGTTAIKKRIKKTLGQLRRRSLLV